MIIERSCIRNGSIEFNTEDIAQWISSKSGYTGECYLKDFGHDIANSKVGTFYQWVFPDGKEPYVEILPIYTDVEIPVIFASRDQPDNLLKFIKDYQFSYEEISRFRGFRIRGDNLSYTCSYAWVTLISGWLNSRNSDGFFRFEYSLIDDTMPATFISMERLMKDYLNDVFGDYYSVGVSFDRVFGTAEYEAWYSSDIDC